MAIAAGLDTGVVAPLLYLVSAIGNLSLAVLVISRGRGRRGALPLALLCLVLFAWQMGESLHATAGGFWGYVRLVASSVAPSFLFNFVRHFVRRERDYGRVTSVLYGITALFALLTAGALALQVLRALVDHWIWNAVYILCLFPFLAFAIVLIVRRRREVADRTERTALNFIALGIAVGVFSGLVDLTVALGSPLPPIGHLGGLAFTLILAVAIFRHRLLETDIPFSRIVAILGIAGGLVFLNAFLSMRVVVGRGDIILVGTAFAVVLVLAVYRLAFVGWYARQEHRRRLEMLGAMAAGVAHEIRNPLASIKGAAQLVQREVKGDSADYIKLVIDEVDRLNQVVESFLDFSRPLTPKKKPVPLADLVGEMVVLQRAASGKPTIDIAAESMPTISADPDLLRLAFGNLLRNAVEAAGSRVVVRVREQGDLVAVEFDDDGPGLTPERMEEIFRPFFTTKARGTGLGLPIARRIVESHGGELVVRNVEPHGARFTATLPARDEA
ncbi:MAG: hypothetical protein HYY17_14865 [Planctomycetes bacterium]|nr:hypothetical protein [Planctomycetota bacterium]